MQQRQYGLICSGCESKIVLPRRIPQGRSLNRWYWPTDSDALTLICRNCEKLSVHLPANVRQMTVEAEAPHLAPSAFWRADFECVQEKCALQFSVHTRVEPWARSDEIRDLVLRAKPAPKCSSQHPLSVPFHFLGAYPTEEENALQSL